MLDLLDSALNALVAPAYAQGAGAPPANANFLQFGMLAVLFIVFYFILIRPQQRQVKEHRNLVAALKKNDEVILSGGLIAKLIEVGETYVTAQIADGVEVKYQRDAVQAVLPKGTFKKA